MGDVVLMEHFPRAEESAPLASNAQGIRAIEVPRRDWRVRRNYRLGINVGSDYPFEECCTIESDPTSHPGISSGGFADGVVVKAQVLRADNRPWRLWKLSEYF